VTDPRSTPELGMVMSGPGQMHQVGLMNLQLMPRCDAPSWQDPEPSKTQRANISRNGQLTGDRKPGFLCRTVGQRLVAWAMSPLRRLQHIFSNLLYYQAMGSGTGLVPSRRSYALWSRPAVFIPCGDHSGAGPPPSCPFFLPRTEEQNCQRVRTSGVGPAAGKRKRVGGLEEQKMESAKLAFGDLKKIGYRLSLEAANMRRLTTFRKGYPTPHDLASHRRCNAWHGGPADVLPSVLTKDRPSLKVLYIFGGIRPDVIARGGCWTPKPKYLARPFLPAGISPPRKVRPSPWVVAPRAVGAGLIDDDLAVCRMPLKRFECTQGTTFPPDGGPR